MFSAGTRVYVYSSSITGKKLGPKRHSIGYVSDSQATHLLNYLKGFPGKNQSFLINSLSIVFTRYGKEQKRRMETRSFLNIVPAFTNTNGIVVQQQVTETLNHFNKGELTKNPHWADLEMNYSDGNGFMGVVVPMVRTAVKMNESEAKAWVTSVLRNRIFKNLLTQNRNLPKLRALGNSDLIIFISNATKKSATHRELINWAESHPTNMVDLVNTLKCIHTAFTKRMNVQDMITMGGLIQRGGITSDNFVHWYTNGLFEDESAAVKKQKMSQPENVGTALATFADSMRLVRASFMNLKLKHD